MPSITTEVEVYYDADDLSDKELIEAVSDRLVKTPRSKREKNFRSAIEAALIGKKAAVSGFSLMDTLKIEVINDNLHKKSLDEIEKFFK